MNITYSSVRSALTTDASDGMAFITKSLISGEGETHFFCSFCISAPAIPSGLVRTHCGSQLRASWSHRRKVLTHPIDTAATASRATKVRTHLFRKYRAYTLIIRSTGGTMVSQSILKLVSKRTRSQEMEK